MLKGGSTGHTKILQILVAYAACTARKEFSI